MDSKGLKQLTGVFTNAPFFTTKIIKDSKMHIYFLCVRGKEVDYSVYKNANLAMTACCHQYDNRNGTQQIGCHQVKKAVSQ